MFKFFYNLTRLLSLPFLSWLLPLLNAKAMQRFRFEKYRDLKNSFFFSAFQSFKKSGMIADFAFEVSSEGELEQVKPLMEFALREGKKVELIYCSESVDHKCIQLFKEYPKQLRLLRLPLLSYNPLSENCPYRWLSAPKLFLCRYDFFPELIFYGQLVEVEFILLWGTLKSFPLKGPWQWPMRAYQKYVYTQFDKIVTATKLDHKRFQNDLNIPASKLSIYDFRPWQIIKRLQLADDTLKTKLSLQSGDLYTGLMSVLNEFPKEKKIIFGSFWDREVAVFKASEYEKLLADGYLIVVVCHKLTPGHLREVKHQIESASSQPVYSIDSMSSSQEVITQFQSLRNHPGVIMLNLKGILCELYSYFGHAFVGGGHGVSVHSLLEPFLAGANVYCGPKVHRSTEYDLIRDCCPESLHMVEDLSQFFTLISDKRNLEYKSSDEVNELRDYYLEHFHKTLNWLGMIN